MQSVETKADTQFTHTTTFFNYNRWSAHDHVGELLARGITQISMVLDGADWVVSWVERTAPDVIAVAEGTDPA